MKHSFCLTSKLYNKETIPPRNRNISLSMTLMLTIMIKLGDVILVDTTLHALKITALSFGWE